MVASDGRPSGFGAVHYFDKVEFDFHMTLQKRRAAHVALDIALEQLGIRVDPITGLVTITPPERGDELNVERFRRSSSVSNKNRIS